jgi:hypothetical protein
MYTAPKEGEEKKKRLLNRVLPNVMVWRKSRERNLNRTTAPTTTTPFVESLKK